MKRDDLFWTCNSKCRRIVTNAMSLSDMSRKYDIIIEKMTSLESKITEANAVDAKQQECMDEKFNKLACQISTQNEYQSKNMETQLSKMGEMVEALMAHHKSSFIDKVEALESEISKMENLPNVQGHINSLVDVGHQMTRMENAVIAIEGKMKETMETQVRNLSWASVAGQTSAGEGDSEAGSSNHSLKSSPPSVLPQLEGAFKKVMDEQKKEAIDIDRRETNVIIFRAKEPDTVIAQDRQAEDSAMVKEFLHIIGADHINAVNIIRLGKKETNKARPVRFSVKNAEEKTFIMGNLNQLKDAPEPYSKFTVCHDLTPAQRKEREKLITEGQEEAEEGIRVVVRSAPGPRWDPKVVKLKKRPA